MIKSSIIILCIFCFPLLGVSQIMEGDPKNYKNAIFLGLDEVGDGMENTADISSAFILNKNESDILRISFDNMVQRKHDDIIVDLFLDREVKVEIEVFNFKGKSFILETIRLTDKSGSGNGISYLRTPETNMLEIAFNNKKIPTKNSTITIKVYVDGKKADEFSASTNGTKDTGNCAFVHHGNQGLTYTEVFYGSASGQSGLEDSGFDEVLQVHEATSIPGNFHMSGTLMPAAEWHNPEFNDWLETLASTGIASMMTSALGQHIMPFTTNEMNDWSVYVESQMVEHMYNYTPRIAWIPERVWLAQGYYPDAGVIDWLGDNWTQHGVWGVVLDDGPHLNGYDNRKIHWMNNGSGVNLRVIPINNSFVGNMHYDAGAAKNQIASMGQYNICVYGTDWEVAAEMNEHDGTSFLDNYINVLWYCHDNYPGINVWKLEDAIENADFNGDGANITKGTYGLLGGADGYGGSNNSWYNNWASTPSHSDFHEPKLDYGTIWWNAVNALLVVTDNTIAQLGWYTLMINLHETGWHSDGDIADWEHRYSSHIKNANVYTEASRWADNQYNVTTACYFDDVDKDGIDELVMHNDKVFMVFEEIGGKANWVFYKNNLGDAYSVVSSDMAYWSESDGDYNESSNNHVAALSDVAPNQQNSVYNISILNSFGDTVTAVLDQWGVQKTLTLISGNDYLDVVYDFYNQTGYVRSGWSPDLLDLIWSGKSNLERMWGSYGSYCGYRNSSSGATAALLFGNGGASHNSEFEGTLVKGDEIKGYDQFKVRLYAGYTSPPSGTESVELDLLSTENMDIFPPLAINPAILVSTNQIMISFTEAVDEITAEDISNYSLTGFTENYTITGVNRQSNWNKVFVTIAENFTPGDAGMILIENIEDLNGNPIQQNSVDLTIPAGITPHTILIDGTNDFHIESELLSSDSHELFITWDSDNLYIGFQSFDLGAEGDFFVNIDTDQLENSGATEGSWQSEGFTNPYLPDYQIAIEHYGIEQLNVWNGSAWDFNNFPGESYIGWSGVGLTEIALPWDQIGDPAGIAISVHITDEDNQTVMDIFPPSNPTGNHPEISYFYAWFQPFISGPMPSLGNEPNQVYIVPNNPAYITSFTPVEQELNILVNTSQEFIIEVSDDENDEIEISWLLDGNPLGSGLSYLFEAENSLLGIHSLQAVATDNVPGNNPSVVEWQIEVIEEMLVLNLKVFLEGPFTGSDMHNGLNNEDVIPISQPYNIAPWNYSGAEEVTSIPGLDIVDWILVELRDAPNAGSATASTTIAKIASFVTTNGTVKGIDGNENLNFAIGFENNIFVVIRHRDHLDIISADYLQKIDGIYDYDFSVGENAVYGGQLGHKELSTGIWGMIGGDADANGIINDADKMFYWENDAGSRGYFQSDFSLDATTDNKDKNNIWQPNRGSGTQIIEENSDDLKSQVPK